MIYLIALMFTGRAWATVEASCEDIIAGRAPRAWVTNVLAPSRDANGVHYELAQVGVLTATSPLDREIVTRALGRDDSPLDPERVNRVDDRWWVYQTRTNSPRVFTAGVRHELRAPQAVRELARRISTPQITRVTDALIQTEVSVHRITHGPVVSRRVSIGGLDHVARPEVHRGLEAFAPDVRRFVESIGGRSEYDETNARLTTTIPRLARWGRLLKSGGWPFARPRLSEVILDPRGPLNLEARDESARDPVGRYVRALAADESPVIIERWEVDEFVRHALSALLIPDSVRGWFRRVSRRALTLATEVRTESDVRSVREIQSLLMRQLETLRLSLADSLDTGTAPSFDTFKEFCAFARPVVSPLTRPRLEQLSAADLPMVLSVLRASMLPDEGPSRDLDPVEIDSLREVYGEVRLRLDALYASGPDERRGGR